MTFKDLWELNPSGNEKETKSYGDSVIKTYGETYENLYWKYKEYFNYWNVKYGDRDPKYIKKSDELKDIMDFLQLGMRNQTFALPKTSRDYYYFGDITQKSLEEHHQLFVKLITPTQ